MHTSELPFGIYWWTMKNLKNHNFEKMKKNCWRYNHFTHVHQKPNSYEVHFLRYGVRQIFFCHFGLFLSLPPNNPKKNFEKIKQASGDVTILNLCNKKHNQMIYAYSDMECTKNDNHMIYGSWDINCNRQIFLSFYTIFCSFTPLLTPILKFGKNVKNT